MRPLSRQSSIVPLLAVVALAGACAPKGDDAADTAPATIAPAPDSSMRDSTRDSTAAPGDATPPATVRSTRPATTPRAAADSTKARPTDSGKVVRPTPPTKPPGGTILLPPRVRDSLRMVPPTSTRP